MTYGGECLSLAAAKATILALKNNPGILRHIWKMGRILRDGSKKMIKKYGLEKHITSYGSSPRWLMDFHYEDGKNWNELKTLFQQYMIDGGILVLPVYWNMTYAHKIQHIKKTLAVLEHAFKNAAKDIKEGRVNAKAGVGLKAVFSRKL